jgi:hypothetical protein
VHEVGIECSKRLEAEDVSKLSEFLKEANPPGESEYGLFRMVLQSADPSTEFMLLYSLLLTLTGPHQADVDVFVRRHEVGVEERPGRAKNETIYSWLRNEVGHYPRSGLPPSDVYQQMRSKLKDLRKLVQKAIDERPGVVQDW